MWDSRSRRLSMRPRRTRALARWDRPDQVVSGYRPLPPFHPTLESLRQMPMHVLRSHGGLWCETWPLSCIKCGPYPSRGCAVSAAASAADESHIPTAELRQESDKLRIDLLSVSPKHPMRPSLELYELDVLDQLRLSSGCGVCRQDAIGIAVQKECRDGVARDVMAEVLYP